MKYKDEIKGIIEGVKNSINSNKMIEEISTKRKAICEGCEFRKNSACGKCGCSISLMTKALKNKACPCGKWDKVKTTSCGKFIIDDGIENKAI